MTPLGSGSGHEWLEVGSHNPAYCDLCGELIWGLYDTGAWQCAHCNYTAHIKVSTNHSRVLTAISQSELSIDNNQPIRTQC